MHNSQLADPLNQFARAMKQVSSKRTKTEADYEELARLEFRGGLYMTAEGPVLPGEALEAAIIQAAKKRKRGPQAKAAVIVPNHAALEYEGPRDVDGLWGDPDFRLVAPVVVSRARVMRTRPRFKSWGATVTIDFEDGQLNRSEVVDFVHIAGQLIGIGDWRPRYGRFVAEF
ncbi:MAG: hypothetical protein VYB54_07490 [Pseudomonadota bacterium]|nr:hypothetical protein [Pseudomonadota bacterium]